jgi:chromosome segregation ATPase
MKRSAWVLGLVLPSVVSISIWVAQAGAGGAVHRIQETHHLLLDLTRNNIQYMDALLAVAGSGCECALCLERAEAELAPIKNEISKLGEAVDEISGLLSAETQQAALDRAAEALKPDRQAFATRMEAGRQNWEAFQKRCPKEGAILAARLQAMASTLEAFLGP